jgi:heme/copper-type cytochrome/quinol oxidase subunit 3
MIVVNFWIRGNSETWPPVGVAIEKIIPTLMTLTLVASSFFIRRGVQALKADDVATFSNNWRYGLTLGGVFALVMAFISAFLSGEGAATWILPPSLLVLLAISYVTRPPNRRVTSPVS